MRKYIVLAMFSLFLAPCLAMAQFSPQETGLEVTGEQAYGTQTPSIGQWVGAKIITPALALVGVIFIILMIYAGFLWMTAGGKPDQTKKARDMMINAIIGVVIIAAAYAITNFVFTSIA